ncbi:hypothetical protein [Nitrosopumilus spindle-shaped virus]|uniref:Uncharacterized protein n=1 Tax=Nitrosopumilus spindle-shaped virus TaxID=2508184 RepID=A0A514K360_9VIRU|nr:hypothetical protein [Nitrosopumilus spindle-shaped virus]
MNRPQILKILLATFILLSAINLYYTLTITFYYYIVFMASMIMTGWLLRSYLEYRHYQEELKQNG